MKLLSAIVLFAATAAATSSNGCNANNCARAVTGTRPGKTPSVTSREADCSSFMQTTVFTYNGGSPSATVTPTAVPAYASVCSGEPGGGEAAYSSACSCWGITATAVTSPVSESCNANNCARAVTGTRPGKMPPVASRMADCSSFLEATVYTDATGGIITTEFPTAVPTYASSCNHPVNSEVAYASACSCWGIPTATVTMADVCEAE